MKHIFIVNPHAGAQSCETVVHNALKPFEGQEDIKIYVKQHKGDSKEVVRKYRAQYPEESLRFYACGGDGTLREVAIACLGVRDVAFTAFALGSGNDYVKYYGGAENFRDVARLMEGTSTPIDMMKVKSEGRETWAMNATHFGLDAKVAVTMDKLRRVPLIGKRTAYPTAVVWGFLTAMRNKCIVWADGKRISQHDNRQEEQLAGFDKILLCTASKWHACRRIVLLCTTKPKRRRIIRGVSGTSSWTAEIPPHDERLQTRHPFGRPEVYSTYYLSSCPDNYY